MEPGPLKSPGSIHLNGFGWRSRTLIQGFDNRGCAGYTRAMFALSGIEEM